MEKHAHSQGNIQRFRAQGVGRLLVKFDETRGLRVCVVSNGLALVKLEKSGGINLAKLALRGPKPPFEGDCGRFSRQNGWTITEQLVRSVELSVYFDTDLETNGTIVYGRLGSLHQCPRSYFTSNRLKH